jgi:chromosome partitioning protein
MGTILTVSGVTGGIGKTTVAVNLCAALALYEKKVLLIDCDPKASATTWLGKTDSIDGGNLSSVLKKKTSLADAIVKTRLAWLDLVPADFNLFATAQSLSGKAAGPTLLKQILHQPIGSLYDYIIIDAPTCFGFLSVLAMTAGQGLVVPIHPHRFSDTDCQCLLKLIHYIRKIHHTRLRIAGFVVNACENSSDIQAFLEKKHFIPLSDLVFDTRIPEDHTVIQAMEHQVPVVLADINSPAGTAFLQIAREIDSIFSHQGSGLETRPDPDKSSIRKISPQKMVDIRERSSEKVEQLAANIADMINEINQNEQS